MHLPKIIYIYMIAIFLSIIAISGINTIQAQWSLREQNSFQLLDSIAQGANQWNRIQETALNDISDIQGAYWEYKIANTFDSIRIQIAPYIQWIVFLWLSFATIGLVYNGFTLVTSPAWWDGNEKAKDRIISILKWVAILTWFYVIITLITMIISFIFG